MTTVSHFFPEGQESRKTFRFVILILFGFLCLLLLGFYLWSRVRPDPLEVAFEKIEDGMPTTEAKAIVGRPITSGGFTWEINGDPR
jgi:hypothetical protein